MSRVTLTESKVLGLKPGPTRRFLFDSIVPGLCVDCTPAGHKSYMLRARWPNARNRARRRIAECGTVTLDQARDAARQWLALLAQGIDPQRELAERKRRAEGEQAATFAAVCSSYFQHLRGRSAERSRREIERELLPLWGARLITDISKADIIAVVDDLRARARRTVGDRSSGAHARLIFNHCRMIFQHAALRYDLERLPTDRLKPAMLGLTFRPRERVLSDAEIRALWAATATLGYPFGAYVRVLLMTGCRRGEVAGAQWSEIDVAAKLWTIPASRAKANAAHVVPLTDDLLELLATLPRYRSGPHLFSTTFGTTSIAGFSRYTARLLREMGDPPPFSLHDLRRTYRSRLSEIGIAETVAERCIAHAPRNAILRVYDRYSYQDEIRAANERWHRRLRCIISLPPDNVVALRA
jgi:integrase